MNPLLDKFDTPFETVPFSKIKNEHFKPAFEAAIAKAKEEVALIVNNANPPTFENTTEALELSGKLLARISSVFFQPKFC